MFFSVVHFNNIFICFIVSTICSSILDRVNQYITTIEYNNYYKGNDKSLRVFNITSCQQLMYLYK